MALTAATTAPVLGPNTSTFRAMRTLTAPFSAGRYSTADFKVKQRAAGANMTVDVGAGLCLVAGTSITGPAGQHKYWVPLTADANLGTITAPVSGTRVDAVIVRVYDSSDIPGDVTDKAEVQYLVNGTVNGLPMNLSAQGNYLKLADVTVASSASSIVDANISNVAPMMGILIPGENGTTYRLGVNSAGALGIEVAS